MHKDHKSGAYCPMGREVWGGLSDKESKIQRSGWWYPKQRMERMQWILPVNTDCRGFPFQSSWKAMTTLGIKGEGQKRIQRLSSTYDGTEQCIVSTSGQWFGQSLLTHHPEEVQGKDSERLMSGGRFPFFVWFFCVCVVFFIIHLLKRTNKVYDNFKHKNLISFLQSSTLSDT